MERGPGGGDAGAEEEAERGVQDCETDTGARERFRGTRMGTEEEAETEGRGEEHDLGGNCEWEGPGSDEEEMEWEAMGIAFGDG